VCDANSRRGGDAEKQNAFAIGSFFWALHGAAIAYWRQEMKKLVIMAALLVVPATALAGVDVSWRNCVLGVADPDAGYFAPSTDINLNCGQATSSTQRKYILQFKTQRHPMQAAAFTAYIKVTNQTSAGNPLPEFWRSDSPCAGTGRPTTEVFDVIPDACANAPTPYFDVSGGGPQASEGMAWVSDQPNGSAQIVVIVARGAGMELIPGRNYYLCDLEFSNRNRTACNPAPGHCGDQVAIVFNTLRVQSLDPLEPDTDFNESGPDKGQICATLHGASAATCAATPVRTSTWGSIKALYR
jgi:hypothetical protein